MSFHEQEKNVDCMCIMYKLGNKDYVWIVFVSQ